MWCCIVAQLSAVWGSLLTRLSVTVSVPQGKAVEEDTEEHPHPHPEPDTSLLKNKVNHKRVVAYLRNQHKVHVLRSEAICFGCFVYLFAACICFGWMRVAVVHLLFHQIH